MFKQEITANELDAALAEQEFEQCAFVGCTFTGIKGKTFEDCTFTDCNFSNCNVDLCILNNCRFLRCKLVGISFNKTKEFGFNIHCTECNLGYTSFERKKLNSSSFTDCDFSGATFMQTNFTQTKLDYCTFNQAHFEQSILDGIDMSTCQHFLIDPTQNSVKKTAFAAHNLAGLLYRFDIVIK
jgi:uncharacterized protein YjbI with pentapeptide repeats